jgi:2-dehydro-3-deoxy-L-rhamnonate dehydrogenase (NAD+)
MNAIDLNGRVAVVTGGAAGIGYAIAQRFVQSGARVVLWDLDSKAGPAAAASLGQCANGLANLSIQVDVSSAESVNSAMQQTTAQTGQVDILVCSAGIAGPAKPNWEYSIDEFQKVMSINVNGVFLCNVAAVKEMMKKDYGRIINIASIAGKEGNPNAGAYSASKAAVIGFTKSIGKETAKTGIRVNCITPAAVKTAIFDQITQEHIDFMLSKIPMARFGKVEEMAAMVAWLASEECSFSTGAVFDLSGGRATY